MADNTQGNQQGSTNNKPAGLSWSQPPKPASPLLSGSVAKPSAVSMPKTVAKPAVQPTRSSGRTLGLFVLGAIVGAGLTWGYYSMNPREQVAGTPNTNTPAAVPTSSSADTVVTAATTPIIGSTGSIILPNPQSAGAKVEITSAPVTVPTWIVVYDVVNGARGNALGAGYFTATSGARSINLLRATEAGKTYWVGKRIDNGDKDFTSADQPVLNAAGQPLYVEFTAR